MLRNYLKIAWRNLKKNRLYTLINMAGLTVGLASCILIGLYIGHELSFDRFHVNADRIVRLTMEYGDKSGSQKVAVTGTRPGPEFTRNFPSVEAFCRITKNSSVVAYGGKLYDEKNFLYADSSFFNMFSFYLLSGDAASSLDAPKKIVLTRRMAEKYFGDVSNALGKALLINARDEYLVTGIVADPPSNSQIQFDFVASFSSLGVSHTEEWYSANYITYLLLRNKSQVKDLQNHISGFMQRVSKEEEPRHGGWLTYHLEPLTTVHLYSALEGLEPNGNIIYIYVLAMIAILILIIACINYTNLATAQSAGRSAEIGIRKVLGVRRWQLFAQFIAESTVLSFSSLILGIFLSIELLPVFNQLTGKAIGASELLRPLPILCFLLLGLIVSFLSGFYPAFILTHTRLASILKSGFHLRSSGSGLRKSLIIFQFVISIFLFSATIIILQQLSFIRNKKLGYDKEQVVVLPVDRSMRARYEDLKKAMTLNPGILSISGSYETPVYVQWGDGISADNGVTTKSIMVNAMPVDLDFIKTMGMQIIAGTDFTQADRSQLDTSNQGANLHYTYILNETAVKALGWTPTQAIGKTISKGVDGTVKAVVRDFHIASLHETVKPVVIFLYPYYVNDLLVKISPRNIPATLEFLESVWKKRVTHRPFEYHFLDEDYDHLYTAEYRTAKVFSVFSSIAIILACLGLFALAAYATVQRTKEIGIRKVLGASAINITALISKDFLKLVFFSMLIASPIAWWAAHQWLQDFAYRTPLKWWVFALAGLSAVVIALITVSFQAIKAATANPVNALRSV